jgi:YesN/AraC family two-component response regulator
MTIANLEPKVPAVADETILMVEDMVEMLDYLGDILSDTYQVSSASNGQEALRVLEHTSIDLIISDISMPEMDGFELLRCVRQERHLYIPFLFLTAHTDKSDVMDALLLGVDAYITKPFDSDELLARVKCLLHNNRKRKELYAQEATGSFATQDPLFERDEGAAISFRMRWLKELEELVKKELPNSLTKIPDLAYRMAVSERTFRNRVKEYTGLTPNEYLMEVRMNKALSLLENQVYLTVSEVAHAVGLEHSSYFTKQFKERFGKTPSEFM